MFYFMFLQAPIDKRSVAMNTPNYFALVENSRFFRLYAEPIVKNDLFPVVNLYRSWPDKANNWANAVFTGSLLEADLDELIANLLHLREDVRAVRKQIGTHSIVTFIFELCISCVGNSHAMHFS